MKVTRDSVLRVRVRRHELDRPADSADDAALLDYGVQDTGNEGATWALTLRGVRSGGAQEELVYAWTWRAAPHAYRRRDLAAIAVASSPFSEEDAAKRIFDAAKPLLAARIPVLDALRTVAAHEREIAARPVTKGALSSRLTTMVDAPFLRFCRPCNATHVYEQVFRLPALQAGLELEPGTSPPVLRRSPRVRAPLYRRLGGEAEATFHGVRNYLRFYGPARIRDVAVFLDARLQDVKEHWPDDAIEVEVMGDERRDPRFVLHEDVDEFRDGGQAAAGTVRLVGSHDPYLQLRDRDLLVPEPARQKALWPVIGRPGAIVIDGAVVGMWRPASRSRRLTVRVTPWRTLTSAERRAVGEQAERLAAHRGTTLAGVTEE